MKVKAKIPKQNQQYFNPFKEKGIYPFNKIGRVLIDKNTADILMFLGENDSTLNKSGTPWMYDELKHDIGVYFPKFYSKRNWSEEDLSDSFITEIPPEHISKIPENITRKGFEVYPEFVREDGNIRPYIIIGATKGVSLNNQLRSIIGYKPTVNKTLNDFLNEARFERNSNWNIETIGIVSMIQFLYKIAFQDLNSQKSIGLGYSNRTELGLTGSTLNLGNKTGSLDPFENSPDKPHDSISMNFQVVNGELVFYNKKSTDPMSIKTINMAGLQKWEETDDYIIYLDKDAVMTTVAQYVTGTYDLFKERKADIDGAMELLKMNNIEWTAEDDSKLILDINKAQLERIANTPTTMEDEDFTPQTFTTRAVPTTYEACFRIDKKSGEIYIGEGYENFYSNLSDLSNSEINHNQGRGVDVLDLIKTDNGGEFILKGVSTDAFPFIFKYLGSFLKGDIVSVSGEIKFDSNSYDIRGTGAFAENLNYNKEKFLIKKWTMGSLYPLIAIRKDGKNEIGQVYGVKVVYKNFQITKTSTPKPFVKSIMPNGKLAFVTGATSESHSFVMKGNKHTNESFYSSLYIKGYTNNFNHIRSSTKLNNTGDFLVSNKYKQLISDIGNFSLVEASSGVDGGVLNFAYVNPATDSFTQLLIYKANLTEAELKAENEKIIISTDNQNISNEYNEENQISIFGIEDFYGNCNSFINGIKSKDDGYYLNDKKINIKPLTNILNNTFKYGYIKKIADLGYLNLAKEVNYFSDQPDQRLSLYFSIENGELVYRDSPNDPFPLKTINNNGITKWEETDDYIIYIDKNATMTTVEQYVTGSYQTFLERKADIDVNIELVKTYTTWTSKDDSNLFIQCNQEALQKLESRSATLDESTQPVVLEAKTVPTTYECCFRVDKSSGEIYIGEGYENLGSELKGSFGCSVSKIELGSFNVVINSSNNGFKTINASSLIIGETYTVSWIADGDFMHTKMLKSIFEIEKINTNKESFLTGTVIGNQESYNDAIYFYGSNTGVGSYTLKKVQITKTSTPKPFVKSVMPSGKLAFVTNATSETHSFVMKEASYGGSQLKGITLANKKEYIEFDKNMKVSILLSEDYCNKKKMSAWYSGYDGLMIQYAVSREWSTDSFKQLLIYKGNLTEAELKAENEKDIKLKNFNYKEENSDLYYTDLFKSHSLGQIGICILNSNYTSLNFGGIFATDFSEIETFKNNLTGARICYYS